MKAECFPFLSLSRDDQLFYPASPPLLGSTCLRINGHIYDTGSSTTGKSHSTNTIGVLAEFFT